MMDTITPEEKEALIKFKEQIADVKRRGHDDLTLVKWLRARRLNVKDAEVMYRKSMQWRKVNKVDTLLTNYEEPEVMKKYYPGGTCGLDQDGRPVFIDCFTKADLRGITKSLRRKDILRAMVYRMEKTVQSLEQESAKQGKLVNQVVQILDMDGFGRKHMWIPGAELITDIIRTIDDNYPEMLYRTYIINAPRLFHVGYNFIKGFLSEDTRKKFVFLGSNWKKELLNVIDADQLPVHFGGTKTDPDGDEYCKSLIGTGGEVPEEYYMATEDEEQEKNLTTVLIKKGDVQRFDIKIDKAPSVIKWYQRSEKDIGFGIAFKAAEQKEETLLQPISWTKCSKFAQFDNLICDEKGLYTFIFDNHDSWWHDRKVSYNIQIVDAQKEIHRLEERGDETTRL